MKLNLVGWGKKEKKRKKLFARFFLEIREKFSKVVIICFLKKKEKKLVVPPIKLKERAV